MAEMSEVKKLVLSLSDKELLALLGMRTGKTPAAKDGKTRWFDKKLCGLTKEGVEQLAELEQQLTDPTQAYQVDRKKLRYYRTLKKMKLEVPDIFRQKVEPKILCKRLRLFCMANDIPEEIVQRVVPALVSYIETGRMRPIIFIGEQGCGKTTAVRMLVEEALRLPTEVIKIPQTDGGHGMTGDCGTYRSADVGCIAKARLKANSLLVAYVFDEIDKVTHDRSRASVDDEMLSITDESNCAVYDNYLETTLVALEHCPMFFTANDLQKINPILADRCTIIRFPSASARRIKSIAKKYAQKKMHSEPYGMIQFNYELMDRHIDHLVLHNVTSLRKHQQLIEAVLENALNTALVQESDEVVEVTEAMFHDAEQSVLGAVKRKVGF